MKQRLGAHVSISGGVEKAIQRQKDIHGSCGQIFAGSPRTWSVSTYTDEEGKTFRDLQKKEGQTPYTIHSTYLVNLATPKDDLFQKSINCLQKELNAADKLGVDYVVFHPGAHTGSGRQNGIQRIAEGIDKLTIPENVTLLLENTAGKGTTLGKTIGELRQIIDKAHGTDKDRLGICIDTCHAHAAGYELKDKEGFKDFVQEIKEDIGIDNLKLLHLNDSKDEKGSEKDNHEHIGQGNIGDEGFTNIVNEPSFKHIPMVLETPVTKQKGYKENITHLKTLIR